MEYKVKIDEFEGPLDLLLHLIKDADIDICDIKLEEITKQYLEYITAMETLNLSVASEYLVMAAELIELKSKWLLPRKQIDDSDEIEEDPRETLIKKLTEYKKYKEVTSQFKELELARQDIFTKLPESLSEYNDNKMIGNKGDVSADDLLQAFMKFIERKEFDKPLNTTVTSKELSINERTKSIRNILAQKKSVSFDELFEVWTKSFVVVTLLSVLEMAKKGEIIIKQDYGFEKIYIELQGCV